MSAYDLTHLRDDVLLRGLDSLAAQDRTTTANLLAHIAEVDARRLYAPAGYSSMHAYCVEKLHLSEGAAWKRVHVARKAREHSVLFAALADGRVHLSALTLLVPHVNAENVEELLAASTHRRKSQIERMLAERFPEVEPLRLDEGIAALSPGKATSASVQVPSRPPVPRTHPATDPPALVAPIAPRRFAVQVTIDEETYDLLRRAQDLIGESREVPQVLRRALELLVLHLERRKAARTDKPRPPRPSDRARNISAEVRRAVWKRDEGQCTFESEDGHRCRARRWLEFDHVVPVARGGKATLAGIRLRCRTHNQLEAERAFGKTFMEEKRSRTA